MLRHLLKIIAFIFFICAGSPAFAAPFEVKNIAVSIQSESAVKARDMAIAKAQRVAFAALVGKTENDIPEISDNQIARLARGFSLQGERLAARSYSATFTIRFNPAATNNFILTSGMQLTPQAASGQTISVNRVVTDKPVPAVAKVDPATGETIVVEDSAIAAEAKQDNVVVVMPILDIGSRRVIWDDPSSWRDVWQKKDQSVPGLKVNIPLGDVDDIADVPDASFLSSGKANITRFLQRYNASSLYVVVAKNLGAALNTAGGMSLSLYRHDGQQLKFLRKQIIRPRQGYLFDDAMPAAMQMIVSAHNNTGPVTAQSEMESGESTIVDKTVLNPVISGSGPIIVTIPYQSLQQWIAIQRRLRMVPGVKSVVPLRVSPSSAQVSLKSGLSNNADLERNLGMQNFTLQRLPSGEMALIDK